MSATIGYAVQDNWIVGGTVSSTSGENVFDLDVTYFTKGFGFGVSLDNAMEANNQDRTIGFNVGKMVMLGSISDKLYVYPNITILPTLKKWFYEKIIYTLCVCCTSIHTFCSS
jgi:hypothetical protein